MRRLKWANGCMLPRRRAFAVMPIQPMNWERLAGWAPALLLVTSIQLELVTCVKSQFSNSVERDHFYLARHSARNHWDAPRSLQLP
jgi:hypothetical protein